MDELQKTRLLGLLRGSFNNNLTELNDCLEKYIKIRNDKKEANQKAYVKHKTDDVFKIKKMEYDKQYYDEHKLNLLKNKKDKYHNDIQYQSHIKESQKIRYILNKSKTPLLNPMSYDCLKS